MNNQRSLTATKVHQQQQPNGTFKIPLTSSNSQSTQKVTPTLASQANGMPTTPKLEKQSTLKSSVKRLFSPNSSTTTTTTTVASTPSSLTITSSSQPRTTATTTTTTISLTPTTSKKYTRSVNHQVTIGNLTRANMPSANHNDDYNTNKSIENISTISTSSSSSTSDTHQSVAASTTTSTLNNKKTKPTLNPVQLPRQTTTSSIRKHLGLFMSKKSQTPIGQTQQSTTSNPNEQRSASSSPPTPPPPPSFSNQIHHQLPPPPPLFQSPNKNQDNSINTSELKGKDFELIVVLSS
jgi:hypothetical protein